MINPESRIPEYLTDKKNTVRIILFTALFALVFINTFEPFGVETLYDLNEIQLLLYSSSVVLAGVLIVVISRVLMIRYSRTQRLKLWQYLAWVLAEVSVMGLFFFIIEKFVLHDPRDIYNLLKRTIRNTALIILLPYTLLWLYFAWIDKSRQLERISKNIGVKGNTEPKSMIAFRDEKDVLRLSVRLDKLAYLEANENYVNVFYLDNDKPVSYMLRNTLKNMDEFLRGKDFARCHRKYLVNFKRVKTIKREKGGLIIELDIPGGKDLPVSSTYVAGVMEIFSKYCAPDQDAE